VEPHPTADQAGKARFRILGLIVSLTLQKMPTMAKLIEPVRRIGLNRKMLNGDVQQLVHGRDDRGRFANHV